MKTDDKPAINYVKDYAIAEEGKYYLSAVDVESYDGDKFKEGNCQ